MEKGMKNQEKEFMNLNLLQRAEKDAIALENFNQQKMQFSEIARNQIDLKN